MPKREMKPQELMDDWQEGIERATSETKQTTELVQEQLNDVAGMRVESGLKGGGGWGMSLGLTNCANIC